MRYWEETVALGAAPRASGFTEKTGLDAAAQLELLTQLPLHTEAELCHSHARGTR